MRDREQTRRGNTRNANNAEPTAIATIRRWSSFQPTATARAYDGVKAEPGVYHTYSSACVCCYGCYWGDICSLCKVCIIYDNKRRRQRAHQISRGPTGKPKTGRVNSIFFFRFPYIPTHRWRQQPLIAVSGGSDC